MKILRVILCFTALAVGLPVQAQTDVSTYTIEKQANYDQSSWAGSTPDPLSPYEFFSQVFQGTSGALFANAMLTPPSGGIGAASYLIGPYNGSATTDNLYITQSFTSSALLEAAFPSGTNTFNLSIQTNTGHNYTDQIGFGALNYPVAPSITGVTNGTAVRYWNSSGHLVVDPSQPLTITWNSPGGASVYFAIANTSFPLTTSTSVTVPGGTLTSNSLYRGNIYFTNGYGAGASDSLTIPGAVDRISYNTGLSFIIQTGAINPQSISYEVKKAQQVVQTSNNPPGGVLGDSNSMTAPFYLEVRSPIAGTVTGPNSTSIPLTYIATGGNGGQGYYQSYSAPVSSEPSLDVFYPDGTYTFPDGTPISLAAPSPSAPLLPPQLVSVTINGTVTTPVWDAQGRLVLDPTKTNVLTWLPVNVANFSTMGDENVRFYSMGDTNYQQISMLAGAYISPTTLVPNPTIAFTSLTIPATGAGSMTARGYLQLPNQLRQCFRVYVESEHERL